ncbi:MAG: metallophosphoesterase [Prevotella sp.]|nr:metallophosphoesterase [Prevotella sp.]
MRRLAVITFCLCLTWCGLNIAAKTRIMLISDPHVMGPGLLINEGEAWEEAIYYDRKLNDYSRNIYDEAIAIALREKPDLFLISGDLTKDGEWVSHQYVVQKLQELKAAGIKALVIPGNHDMGTDEALYYDGDNAYEADTINAQQFAELYKDFGYGDDVERDPETLTWCCEPIDGLVIIGIDSGHEDDPLNGVISKATFDWVTERAQTAKNAGKLVFVMMHHTMFPHVTNVEKFSSTYTVKLGVPAEGDSYIYYDYRSVCRRLSNAGVSVAFSGHVHASDIAKDSNNDLTRTIFDICTASCAAYPNPYRLLTLNDDGATMRIQTRYISELPGIDDFASLAENRMRQGLVNLVYGNTYNQEISDLFAELFKMHVMGNEPENPHQQEFLEKYEEYLPQMKNDMQINSYLNAYGVSFDELTQMVHSLLEDKSNYGDPDRESCEDDLNTTIPVRGDGWTAVRSIVRESPDEAWYTLQGLRIPKPSRKGLYIHGGKLSVVK